jgi:hypothetical protein
MPTLTNRKSDEEFLDKVACNAAELRAYESGLRLLFVQLMWICEDPLEYLKKKLPSDFQEVYQSE